MVKIIPFLLSILVVITGCAGQQSRAKSSVVDYLYPKNSEIIVQPSISVLKLPVNIGIAFVPEQATQSVGVNMWTGVNSYSGLTEANKVNLLERVADNFRQFEFVKNIEVIPSAYLTDSGGFSNLDQIRTMYGVDVIALVSYDQVQFTDEDWLSLTYWTVIGAYVVAGEKNDTSTMLDTVVYDIQSRKMLFRAPGTSNVKSRATPINLSEELRENRIKSFNAAADQMTANLTEELDSFKKKIKHNPDQVKIVHRDGYTGGAGSISLFGIIFLFIGLLIRLYFRVQPYQ